VESMRALVPKCAATAWAPQTMHWYAVCKVDGKVIRV